MIDTYLKLVLNSTCRFEFVTSSNKHLERIVYKPILGYVLKAISANRFSQNTCLLPRHQDIAPKWAFSIFKLAVLHTITSTMLVAWKNRQGMKLTSIIASWRYYSDHTKFSYVNAAITKLMNVVLNGELVSDRYGLSETTYYSLMDS